MYFFFYLSNKFVKLSIKIFILTFLGSIVTRKAETAKPTATRHDVFVEKLSAIPEIAKLGPLVKSSQPAELTGNVELNWIGYVTFFDNLISYIVIF